MPIRRAAGTPPQETAPSTAAEGEPDATSEESPSVEEQEEQAASSASAGEGEASGDAEPTENGEEADEAAGEKKSDESGKKGLALPAVTKGESDKCKDCVVGQCATHCYVLLLRLKDGYKLEKSKVKKVKRTIPAWATISASKKVPVSIFPGSQPKVDDILIEAIKSCADKSGMSYQSVMKYIVMKYPGLDLDKRKFLIKKALKKQVEKGAVKQLKGKGLSGSFAIGKLTTKPQAKKTATAPGVKTEALGDALPLIITQLCEPKEASYILIKKYVEQHFPHLNIESRPDLLKSALIKAVDRGLLERITGKGASGTFQLKRSADKAVKGGPLDDAIVTAITAMNEPKTCSTQTLRKYLVHNNKDSKEGRLVATLRKTLTKCKMLGWMEQITGKGFQGTYQLSFPYYPSPAILYPDKVIAPPPKKSERAAKNRWQDSSDEEDTEDEEEEEEDDDDEEEEDDEPPPPKRKAQKRPAQKARIPPRKMPRTASPSKAKGKRPAPKKRAAAPAKKPAAPAKKVATPAKKVATPAKKVATPAKKAPTPAKKAATPAKKPAASLKESPPPTKATPVKKAAPAKKPKTPVVKKMTNRGSKRPGSQKSSLEEPAAKKEAKTKPSARRSQRGKH